MFGAVSHGVEGSLDHGLLPLRGDRPRPNLGADTLLDLVDRNVADTPFYVHMRVRLFLGLRSPRGGSRFALLLQRRHQRLRGRA